MIKRPSSFPIKVLLVENRLQDQIAFQQALTRSGVPFEVTLRERAEDIPAAMLAGNETFDIVVVDQDLPGMTGLAAYLQLQRETALPPFIMLTGAGSESLAVKALQAGMYDYIIKDPHQGYLNVLAFKLQDVCQRPADRHLRLTATAELQEAHAELERQVAERTAQLAASNKELEAFAYSVSHDLRAPLRAIDGFSKLLLEDKAAQLDEEGRDSLNRIMGGAQRMSQLIDDLLRLSRITRSEMNFTHVNLSNMVKKGLTGINEIFPGRVLVNVIEQSERLYPRLSLTGVTNPPSERAICPDQKV